MVGTVGRGGLLNETLMIRESLFVGIELSFGVERGQFSALQTRYLRHWTYCENDAKLWWLVELL